MRTAAAGVIGGLIGALSVTGCGESCQSTCFHVYSPAECGVQVSGVSADELIRNCDQECNDALAEVGNMGAYNPEVRPPGGNAFVLQNEVQAAAWMDCVWGVECEDLASVGGACYGP
ncbi:MAG: hypothetical protein KTR31_08250 [Myxococcales bacterium]|nr:hypothetical protein [Myxococcales bacterium]